PAIIGTDATAGVLTLNLSHAGVHAPLFTNNGSMVVTAPIGGDSQIDINPVDPGATFTNASQITLTIGTVLNDDPGNSLTPGLLVNSGTISFLGDGVTAVNTHGEFTDPLDNTGTIIINGGGTLDPTLTFTDFLGQLSGNGTVQVRDGLAFFGFGAGDAAGTIQFFGVHGIVDVFDASQKIGATLENFGLTDRV